MQELRFLSPYTQLPNFINYNKKEGPLQMVTKFIFFIALTTIAMVFCFY